MPNDLCNTFFHSTVSITMTEILPSYRNINCPNCGRVRVELDGICEKCTWDVDKGEYAKRCEQCNRPMAGDEKYCSESCLEYVKSWEGVFDK